MSAAPLRERDLAEAREISRDFSLIASRLRGVCRQFASIFDRPAGIIADHRFIVSVSLLAVCVCVCVRARARVCVANLSWCAGMRE